MRVRQPHRTPPRAHPPAVAEEPEANLASPHGPRWKLAGLIGGLAFWAIVIWLTVRLVT